MKRSLIMMTYILIELILIGLFVELLFALVADPDQLQRLILAQREGLSWLVVILIVLMALLPVVWTFALARKIRWFKETRSRIS